MATQRLPPTAEDAVEQVVPEPEPVGGARRTRTRHGTQRYLRWPIFVLVMVIVAVEMGIYFVLRGLVLLYEKCLFLGRSRGRLAAAESFDEWVTEARRLDAKEGREAWKKDPVSPFYDWELLQSLSIVRKCAWRKNYRISTHMNFEGA